MTKRDAKKPDSSLVRLNKAISDTGLCSRRKADELIENGQVKVNGKKVKEMGFKVNPNEVSILVDNKPLNRYALRGTDLHVNEDGTTDIYIQPTDPGGNLTSNWLPSPTSGEMSLTMRLYWPKEKVIAGNWEPPSLVVVKENF